MITEPPKPQRPRYDPRLVLATTALIEVYETLTTRMVNNYSESRPTKVAAHALAEAHREEIKAADRLTKSEVRAEWSRLLDVLAKDQFERELQERRDSRNRVSSLEKLLDSAMDLHNELTAVMNRLADITGSKWRDQSRAESDARRAFDHFDRDGRDRMRSLWRFYALVDDGRPPEEMPAYLRGAV